MRTNRWATALLTICALTVLVPLDGAGPWTVFWRIIFPLLAPIDATVGS